MQKQVSAAILILCTSVMFAFTQRNAEFSHDRNPSLIPDTTSRPLDFVSIFDTLPAGEMITVGWFTQGCFHSAKDSLLVRRLKSGFWVKHNGTEKTLAPSEMNALRDFDYGLKRIVLQSGGCTTTERYTYTGKDYSIVAAIDETCRWRGFHALLTALHL